MAPEMLAGMLCIRAGGRVWPLLVAGGAAGGLLGSQCVAQEQAPSSPPETAATSWLHWSQPGASAVCVRPGEASREASGCGCSVPSSSHLTLLQEEGTGLGLFASRETRTLRDWLAFWRQHWWSGLHDVRIASFSLDQAVSAQQVRDQHSAQAEPACCSSG